MGNLLKTTPAVFAVNDMYQIMVPVKAPSLMWVRVGDKEYYDDVNGVLKSDVKVHRMIVPMAELDKAKKYTICYRKIVERKAYFSETEDVCEKEYEFCPVTGYNVTAYQVADTHGNITAPVMAAKNFEKKYGKIDFLILNGDIIDNCDDVNNFDAIYEIASEIAHGSMPIVCTRGNHDNRGVFAEKIVDYFPTSNGNTYYSFKLGNIWGLVLDCGEDKVDSHEEYGNTICCHLFRQRQTKYIEDIIRNSEKEYLADDVMRRIVLVHVPFTKKTKPQYDIEQEIYTEWADMLKNEIKPELMIVGHEHRLEIEYPGDDTDKYGHPCPIIVGSWVKYPNDVKDYGCTYKGVGVIMENKMAKAVFTDDAGKFYDENDIVLQ